MTKTLAHAIDYLYAMDGDISPLGTKTLVKALEHRLAIAREVLKELRDTTPIVAQRKAIDKALAATDLTAEGK